MQIPFTGQCACGAVRFRCKAQPRAMYNCHCKACQAITGAACMRLLVMQSDMVDIDGPVQTVRPPFDWDRHGQRFRCAVCAAVLFASSTKADLLLINADWLADARSFVAIADIWTVDAGPALCMDTHIPKVWKSPPLIGDEFV